MPSKNAITPIEAGCFYHVFNRGNNFQTVFFQDSDYKLFLDKYKKYMKPVCNLLAYALIPNHYHFLIEVNEDIERLAFSRQYKRFILSYTNSINNRDGRSGNLFLSVFKRLKVENENYLLRLLFYIHHNPQNHGITEDFQVYKYSSYRAYLSNTKSLINKKLILELLDGKENFKDIHQMNFDEDVLKNIAIE